jgi:hypothetical protein
MDAKTRGRAIPSFFNARCHDAGLKCRRLIIFDTVMTQSMGARANHKSRLHFHGLFELPQGWTLVRLKDVLRRVFGDAAELGKRQLHFDRASTPSTEWKRHYTFNGSRANGPLGKVLYAIAHAGSTYRQLELNESGKRSRTVPWQGSVNKTGSRLARGIPSNFNRKVVFYDQVSVRAGREAFDAWVKMHRARLAREHNPGAATVLAPKRQRRTEAA